MTQATAQGAYGELLDPVSVRLERTLPGPISRVWSYLVESELRSQWLASGEMDLTAGAPVEFVWRNDELSGGGEDRPDDKPQENRMDCAVVTAQPPRLLVIRWGSKGSEVTFELEPQGSEVKLVLTHRRLPDRDNLLGVSAGWHAHLELLAATLSGAQRPPFWTIWKQLRTDYDQRLPA